MQFGVTEGALALSPAAGPGDLLISAELIDEDGEQVPGRFYNGKIDSPRIYDRTLSDAELSALRDEGGDEVGRGLLAAWDFSRDISNWTVSDGSGNEHHGAAINKPLRGVTGQNWDGSELAWPRAPEQYGAIHFHDDDLSDAGWTVSFEWTVPEDLPSGLYAARVFSGDGEDFIPFAVCPHLGKPTAEIVLVLPDLQLAGLCERADGRRRNARRPGR